MGPFSTPEFSSRTEPKETRRMAAATARVTKSFVAGLGNLGKACVPKLRTGMKYAKTEIMPPTPGEFGAYRNAPGYVPFSVQAMQSWTVKETIMKALVVVDIYFFFRIGEVMGRRSFVGYGGMDGATTWSYHL